MDGEVRHYRQREKIRREKTDWATVPQPCLFPGCSVTQNIKHCTLFLLVHSNLLGRILKWTAERHSNPKTFLKGKEKQVCRKRRNTSFEGKWISWEPSIPTSRPRTAGWISWTSSTTFKWGWWCTCQGGTGVMKKRLHNHACEFIGTLPRMQSPGWGRGQVRRNETLAIRGHTSNSQPYWHLATLACGIDRVSSWANGMFFSRGNQEF